MILDMRSVRRAGKLGHLRSDTGVTGMLGMKTRRLASPEAWVHIGAGSKLKAASSGMGSTALLKDGRSGSVMVLRGVAQSDSVSCVQGGPFVLKAWSAL